MTDNPVPFGGALEARGIRAHGFHTAYCPVVRTIGDSVAICTSLRMESIRE